MTRKLLVRQGGGTAAEVDFIADFTPRKGAPWLDAGSQPLIQMGQRFASGESAQGYLKVTDPAAVLSSDGFRMRPWAEVRLTEDASGDELTLAWMRVTANDASRSSTTIAGDEIEHDPQLMDCNLDLRGIPFRNAWERDAETDQDRLNVLEGIKLDGAASSGTIRRRTTDITIAALASGHLADFSDPTDLEAHTYADGTEVTEVISDIAEQSGKQWGVVLHHDGGSTHKCLLYIEQDDLTTYTTDVRISDDPADWDPDDATAPTFEPHWKMGAGREQNMEGVVSGMIGVYTDPDEITRTVYVETGEAPEDWETWVDVFNDDSVHTAPQVERHVTWQLQDRRRPYQSIKVSILVRADQAHLVEAGMAIETKSVVMEPGPNKHTWLWRRIAEKTIEPVADGRYWLHLHLERPHHAHGPAGGRGNPSGPSGPTPPEPGTVTTATGAGAVNNDDNQSVSVPGSTGGLIAVLLTNAVTATTPDYYPVTAGPAEPMTIIGQITHPTPPSGGNKDGDMLIVAYLANPTTSGTGAHVEWGTQAGSQFGSLKGYWTTPSTGTPTVITNSGTSASASVTPTGAGAEDLVLMCAGWRIWSLGNASQTPVDGSSQADTWALPYNNSAGQNDGCWYGGVLAGAGTRTVNVVTSTPWVAAAIILGGVGGTAGETTEPTGSTGSGSPGSGGTFSPINHIHAHGLLSADELHYHDVSQIEGTVSYFPIDDLTDVNAPTPADQDVLTWDDTASEWVAAAAAAGGDLDDIGDVNAPTPADGDILTWDSTPGEWVSAAPSVGAFTDTIVYKSADESVANTTLQADDHLIFAVGTNQEWVVEYNLFVTNAANTGDIKFDLSLPASAVATQAIHALGTGSSTAENNLKAQAIASGTAISGGVVASGTIGLNAMRLWAYVDTAGTSGNVTLQWAQNATDGSNATVVKKGSWLRAHRVV